MFIAILFTVARCWKQQKYPPNKGINKWISLVTQMVKNPPAIQETWVQFLGRKILWRMEWLPIPVFLPGEFHGQGNLAGYTVQGCKVKHD